MRQPKRILLFSEPRDIHGRAVAYAIRAKGHECVELFTRDFPTICSFSLRGPSSTGPGFTAGRSDYSYFNTLDQNFDTVWVRRVYDAVLPDDMHPGDRILAERQCNRFIADVLLSLKGSQTPFLVNDPEREFSAQSKPYQLRTAKLAGLAIPDTLISNDPDDIRSFIRGYNGAVAHKGLLPAAWRGSVPEKQYHSYTTPVRIEDLPTDSTLRLCPGIFQPLLHKKFEVRVSAMGQRLFAVKIHSQSDDRASVDWRKGQWYVPMEPYDLPEDVAEGIRRFLAITGLVAAQIDLIVTPESEHVFLEANCEGQFLWLEDRAGLPLLDAFSDFLIAGRETIGKGPEVRLSEFLQVWDQSMKHDLARHVIVTQPASVPDTV